MDHINYAVADAKSLMNQVAKAKSAIKEIVHQDSQMKQWSDYRNMYFSGKYKLDKELFDLEKGFMR